MGGEWPYNYYFMRCYFLILFKTAGCSCVEFPSNLFHIRFVSVRVVQLNSRTDTATARKNSRFISSERSFSVLVVNLSIVVHALPMHILTSLSVDEILLPRYMNRSTSNPALPMRMLISLSVDEILLPMYMNWSTNLLR